MKKEQLTYIIKSGNYYKIGRTTDLKIRLSGYRTHNPQFELIGSYKGDFEKALHAHFSQKHFNLEWFELDSNDLLSINSVIETLTNNKDIEEYLNIVQKLKNVFGKTFPEFIEEIQNSDVIKFNYYIEDELHQTNYPLDKESRHDFKISFDEDNDYCIHHHLIKFINSKTTN